MRSRVTTVAVITAGIACLSLALVGAQSGAQRKQESARAATASVATPKLADGHPDLNGTWQPRLRPPGAQDTQETPRPATPPVPTPKLADGHPDLNGQWYHRIGPPVAQLKPGQSYDAAIAKPVGIAQFNPGKAPYKPEYVAKVKDLDERQVQVDPAWYCQPPGVPRIGPPQKIVQTAKELVFLYDDLNGNFFRVVRMNAAHRDDIDPSAHGDSIGRRDV